MDVWQVGCKSVYLRNINNLQILAIKNHSHLYLCHLAKTRAFSKYLFPKYLIDKKLTIVLKSYKG